MRERIQKILSARGVASRRAAEELIRQGRVTVDGVPCALGASAEPDCRTIAVDGVPIPPPPEHVYLMLHKPRGYITTLSDERGRRTAASLVDCGTRVYPVGRLDYDSEGLLLFTNDGVLADRLMHPRREISKVYEVTARGLWMARLSGCGIRSCSTVIASARRRSSRPRRAGFSSRSTKAEIARSAACARRPGWRCSGCGALQRDRCSSERSRPAHGVRSPKRSLPRCGRKQKGEILYDGRHPDEHT